jgi:uncharacterized DUF497 family protein
MYRSIASFPALYYDFIVAEVRFEWDEEKNKQNQLKHGVPFDLAQYAFADPDRVIAEDIGHSQTEKRYYCLGGVGDGILRFVSPTGRIEFGS